MMKSMFTGQAPLHAHRARPRSRFVSVPHPGRLHVLLVDDEIHPLLPLADALRGAGMMTTLATSDEEALCDVRMSRPDVVVLDANIAERGLLVGIRAVLPSLPVVLMIRVPVHDPALRALLASAHVTYIEKPVHALQLLEVVLDAHHEATGNQPRS